MNDVKMGKNEQIFLDDISNIFNPERFDIERRPLHVGNLENRFTQLPSCLDMLIKYPGQGIVLPEPWSEDKAVADFISKSVEHETRFLPGWHETHYLYLTVDQRHVPANKTHRNAGWHFDGMQGTRYPRKLQACHAYICSDNLGTEFSTHAIEAMSLDERTDNWFDKLGEKSIVDKTVTMAPGEILAMSAYQMHRSPVAQQDTFRTFLRMDVTVKQFDRIGNTINPDLPPAWEMVERPIPEGLGGEIEDAGWERLPLAA
jgi:hypothetical protein